MREEDFKKILETGEGISVEFKESFGSKIAKEISAFANTSGGKIFIGVNDRNQVTGCTLNNKLKSEIQDIANNCDPKVSIEIESIPIDNKEVVVITVVESIDKPVGCSEGFFLRIGPSSQKMNRNEILYQAQKTNQILFESKILKDMKYPDDFNEDIFQELVDRMKLTNIGQREDFLRNLHLGEDNGEFRLNNAGAMFFGKQRQRFLPQVYVTCVLYKGIEKLRIIDKKDFREGLVQDCENAVKFLEQHLRLAYVFEGFGPRKEVLEIPEEALKEALYNAVIHRDYFDDGARVMVEIFDDRVEISNPGELLFDKAQLGKISKARNPIIFDIFNRLHLVDKIGHGINSIRQAALDRNIKVTFETGSFFHVIFSRPPFPLSTVTPRLEEINKTQELCLMLTNPHIIKETGKKQICANARLVYCQGELDLKKGVTGDTFSFKTTIGSVDIEELRWYLEKYYLWPTGVFKERARKIEKQLPTWGQAIYETVAEKKSVRSLLGAWRDSVNTVPRRFTIFVDIQQEKDDRQNILNEESGEAAAHLLNLPWELMHDGDSFLFQGAMPVAVRRSLPTREIFDRKITPPPIRVLLVSPRPENENFGYFNHRSSSLPLVDALEKLGDLVEVTILAPPTFKAMAEEFRTAFTSLKPYHILHFDGHGVFDHEQGLGGLVFEDPLDTKKLENRQGRVTAADDFAAILRDYRIPLVFLDVGQSAKVEHHPMTSIAAALLGKGVSSVVAMSYSVTVETSRRFTAAFYKELAKGANISEAMLAGQQELYLDPYRLEIFGAGSLELKDWFVPVLYQKMEDVRLLKTTQEEQKQHFDSRDLEKRLGALPETPGHSFIGRSRELLKLERLLELSSYAVVCGQGGEGKTTLAVELARWLVRSRRYDRAVFVCVEDVYNVRTVVDRIGRQLVNDYSVAEYKDSDLLTKALQPIEQVLLNENVLIVLDNMESLFEKGAGNKGGHAPAGDMPNGKAAAGANQKFLPGTGAVFLKRAPGHIEISQFAEGELQIFFELCRKLMKVSRTRLLFTSREPLPGPFDAAYQRVTIGRMEEKDTIELVHRAMIEAGITPKEDDKRAAQEEVENLVEAVHCHARSLVLLAPYVSSMGVRQTTENLAQLMAVLHEKYPDERERSLFASLELSLRRLPAHLLEKLPPLGLFQGGGDFFTLSKVLELDEKKMAALAAGLISTGLAEAMAYAFLRFHPALCPYLYLRLQQEDEAGQSEKKDILSGATTRWVESMGQLSSFLYQQLSQDAKMALNLTALELPNLVRLLEVVRARDDADAIVQLATSLEQLIAQLGRPHLLDYVVAIRKEAAERLPSWSHSQFISSMAHIERSMESGQLPQALKEAQALKDRCLSAGENAYPEAAYDTAVSRFLLGRALRMLGASQAALAEIAEARKRFQDLAEKGDIDAARMASVCLAETGDCLLDQGRLDEAAAAYEEGIKLDEGQKRYRDAAVGTVQLGTVRLQQHLYAEALANYREALEIFTGLDEPASVAGIHHQIGMAYDEAGQYEAAEISYRKALSIRVSLNINADEAASLGQLGNLYKKMERFEEAVVFYRQAADKFIEIEDMAKEGFTRSNIADTLIKLNRFAEARGEIQQAIACKEPYGHAAELWKTWDILCNLEKAEGNREAAAAARQKALEFYLAYRRDGGENYNPSGRLCLMVLQAMQAGDTGIMKKITAELEQIAQAYDLPDNAKILISKLQAVLAGSRDPGLAADPGLDYDDAAEILFLLEKISEK